MMSLAWAGSENSDANRRADSGFMEVVCVVDELIMIRLIIDVEQGSDVQ